MSDPQVNFFEVQQAFEKAWEGKDVTQKEVTKGKGFKPYKRWEWFMEPRTYPSGERFDPAATYNAWQAQKGKSSIVGGGGGGVWTYFGNTDVPSSGGGAGRINMVRVDPSDPNTYFGCAPGGGLWKSTNQGVSWTLMNTDDLSSIGVSDVAIDYNNTDIIYIGTGDGDAGDTYALGVLKSTDSGLTWNTTGLSWTVQQGRRVSRLAMHPSNSSILLAATSNGVYKTTDGGATWNQEQSGNIKEVLYKPGDPSIAYACGSGNNFYRSSDGGDSWTNITSGLPTSDVSRFAMAVTPANANYVYVLAGSGNNGFRGYYRSTDSGLNFTEMSIDDASTPNLMGWATDGSDSGGQAWYDLATAADPNNADVVYTGGVNVYKSTDGGVTWSLSGHWYGGGGADYCHADIHGLEFIGNTSTLLVGCDGGVFRTADGGVNYDDVSSNLEIAQQYRLGISTANSDQLLTGWQDNGTNWKDGSNWSRPIGGDGFECIIDHTNENICYGALYYGNIRRSTTGGGGGYSSIVGSNGSGVNEGGAWLTPYIMSPSDHNTLFVGKSTVYKTTDGGANWTAGAGVSTGALDALHVAPADENYVYCSDASSMWRSTDGGANFTSLSGLSGDYITYIATDPTDATRVWISLSTWGGGASKVYFSDDAGATWSDFSTGLPSIPCNTIVYADGTNDGLYVGTDAGVYYRDGTFGSWQPYNSGLPNVVITELEIHYATNTIVASTYGRGVWHAPLFALPQVDAGLTAINNPDGTLCDPNFIPEIEIGNFGNDPITEVVIDYQVTGGAALQHTWNGVLVTGQTAVVSLPAINEGMGAFTFDASIGEVNGAVGDDNALNDASSTSYYVSGNDNNLTLFLLTDCWASESSWEITNDSGEVVHSGNGYNNDTQYEIPICLGDGCYTFTMYDSYGDGLSSCSGGDFYLVDEGGVTLFELSVLNFGFSESHAFCVPYVTVPGCTEPFADNYNSLATEEDGSCVFSCNYINFSISTDCWGGEVSWDLTEDATGTVIASVAGGELSSQTTYNWEYCLEDGCYTLNIYDSFGDGLAGIASGCAVDGDYFIVDYDGTVIVQMADPNYGSQVTHNFCFDPNEGCTDSSACNYDSAALVDDGSCLYLDACGVCGGSGTMAGCTDNLACNFNASADCDDGSCQYLDACGVCGGSGTVAGCTDNSACNYNASADCDDGSCQYLDACGVCGGSGTVAGCTDNSACNYNASADCDDGSCQYLDACGVCGGSGTAAGCMDSTACNYDSNADCDDGSCDYDSCSCFGDMDNNGFVNSNDLLLFLADFGCVTPPCVGDFDGDGQTSTSDMLMLLTVFGLPCP